MKILKQSLILALLAFAIGILFNLVFTSGVNPFKGFTSGIDISLDHRALVEFSNVISAFEDGSSVFIDARDKKDFEKGHIPHSLNAPYFYMERSYSFIAEKIHLTDTLVFYGEDEKDIAPLRSADYYEKLGFKKTKIVLGGIEKWKALGLPLDGRNEDAK